MSWIETLAPVLKYGRQIGEAISRIDDLEQKIDLLHNKVDRILLELNLQQPPPGEPRP